MLPVWWNRHNIYLNLYFNAGILKSHLPSVRICFRAISLLLLAGIKQNFMGTIYTMRRSAYHRIVWDRPINSKVKVTLDDSLIKSMIYTTICVQAVFPLFEEVFQNKLVQTCYISKRCVARKNHIPISKVKSHHTWSFYEYIWYYATIRVRAEFSLHMEGFQNNLVQNMLYIKTTCRVKKKHPISKVKVTLDTLMNIYDIMIYMI